jgi:hypothetical protein
MTTGRWTAITAIALLVLVVSGWFAWDAYQGNKAKKIPLFPGARLDSSSVYDPGSG